MGGSTGSSSLEYFNTTAQTPLFSLSKHLHTPAFFSLSLTNSCPHSVYQLFNFSNNSFQTFQSTSNHCFHVDVYGPPCAPEPAHPCTAGLPGVTWVQAEIKPITTRWDINDQDPISFLLKRCLSVNPDTLWQRLVSMHHFPSNHLCPVDGRHKRPSGD